MTSRMTLGALTLCGAVALSACTTVVARYYTLMPTASDAPPAVAPVNFQFEMLAVRMPVQVDQPQLVVRQDNGSLAILENQRWGAPLADEFHDALASQLEARLGTRDLAGMPKSTGMPIVSVQTDVRRFDSLPGNYALVDVVWSLALRDAGQQRRTLTCSSVLRETAGTPIESLVLAHQHLIAQLATRMASTAKGFAAREGAVCP
jgi:uncharacterized lipoprotein YmbA